MSHQETRNEPVVAQRASWASFGLASLVLVLGGVGAFLLVRTAPKTEAEPESPELKVVQTVLLRAATHHIRVVGYGEVVPAREVTLSSEVRGRVVRQHPGLVTGGHVLEGEELFGIDDTDYRIAVAQQEATLAEAESELQLEAGRQVVAAREWKQLEQEMPEIEVNRELVLREPHRLRIEATIDRARSLLSKAELDLQRTSVKALFNALVLEEGVELGQLVDVGDRVATLAGADEFWIQTSVRQDELPRINLPSESAAGAQAKVTLETGGHGVVYQGQVIRLLSDLEPNGRNARIIVSVKDPLGLLSGGRSKMNRSLPLLLRSFVRVEIDAGELAESLALERGLLREGDQVWVVDKEGRLQIRQGEVLWRQGERVYLADNLEAGDEVVQSRLRTVVPGTPVQKKTMSDEVSVVGGDPDDSP